MSITRRVENGYRTDSYAVIGAGFGDEGKGLITDYLSHQAQGFTKPLVVRYNGGAQAGHTVVTPEGQRHVFGHMGSGTLNGTRTHLGKRFIVNPLVLKDEYKKMYSMGFVRGPTIHPEALVTTIYDMALNSLREIMRGVERHGSCGLGINETVTRSMNKPEYRLTFADLSTGAWALAGKLEKIEPYWEQQYKEITSEMKMKEAREDASTFAELMSKASQYMRILQLMDTDSVAEQLIAAVQLCNVEKELPEYNRVIFEGAQGLMLDEYLGQFPHVTRSMTGLPYALMDAANLNVGSLMPIYVTRAYATRHGAGDLKHENELIIADGTRHIYDQRKKSGTFEKNIPADTTNVTNTWQGEFRYAPLDILEVATFIKNDYERGKVIAQTMGVNLLEPLVAITCLDHVITDGENDAIKYYDASGDGGWCSSDWYERILIDGFKQHGLRVFLTSTGPTRLDVRAI